MALRVAGFEWDEGNWPKCGKHGVSKTEIEALFQDRPDVYADPAHSIDEQRLRAVGVTRAGKWVLVAFTLRNYEGGRHIRPISARYMHQKEVKHYEQQTRS